MSIFFYSPSVLQKLKARHSVETNEVEECFSNRYGLTLVDDREEHKTEPPTRWFIAETASGRLLKVMFVKLDDKYHIKSAYEPSPSAIEIYEKYAL